MHTSKTLARAAACALAAALLFACEQSTEPPRATTLAIVGRDTLTAIQDTTTFAAQVLDQRSQPMTGIAIDNWESSNPGVVSVTPTGFATARTPGSATLTAHSGTLSATKSVTVFQKVTAVIVSGPQQINRLGGQIQLTAEARDANFNVITGRAAAWTSSNASVATIDPVTGVATSHGVGIVQLRATVEGHFSDYQVAAVQIPASMTVTTPDTLRSIGATTAMTAALTDSGGAPISAPNMRWQSADMTIVTVDSMTGVTTAVANGQTYMRAIAYPLRDSVLVRVRQRISAKSTVSPATADLTIVGDTVHYDVQARDANDHPIPFGGSTIVFALGTGTSSGTFTPVVDHGNGHYTSDFVATTAGTSRPVVVTTDGAPVTAQPSVRVVAFSRISVSNPESFPFSCGVLTSGEMYCWGRGDVRGTGTNVVQDEKTATLVAGNHNWSDVEAGYLAVCGIADGGKLFCWGGESQGVLGNGSPTTSSSIVPGPQAVSPDSTFIALSMRNASGGCAITTAHHAACWGLGTWGRLGNAADTNVARHVAVVGGQQFKAIATSYSGTCGVTDAGGAMCWGFYAILGNAGPYDSCNGGFQCSKSPATVAGGKTFTSAVIEDGNNSCAIGTDDVTYCWHADGPTAVPGAPTFTSIATGDMDFCGVASDEFVYCWGTNRNGRFGTDPNFTQVVPLRIPGDVHFSRISMGQKHACGVTPQGSAYCWGSNDHGQLGDHMFTASATPVRVKLAP